MSTDQTGPTGGCLRVLLALRDMRWRAPAYVLNDLGMLNERGRISDLRRRWGVPIEAQSQRVRGRVHTLYVVPRGSRREARALIRAGLGALRGPRAAG